MDAHVTSRLLLVRPIRFARNEQTVATNAFQGAPGKLTPDSLQRAALREFEGLATLLTEHGMEVFIQNDTAQPHTPDSIFPNNWISFHGDGTVVTYPMCTPNRRRERRTDWIDSLCDAEGFVWRQSVDLVAGNERQGRFLEGTGSLVLDRRSRRAYACLSARTHLAVAEEFGARLGYEVIVFQATDRSGTAVFHTNVMMSVGEEFAVLCDESIADEHERRRVRASLEESGHSILSISMGQMERFGANLLQIENAAGERFIVLSTRAWAAFDAEQRRALGRYGTLLPAALDTIEHYGGGGARCMLAELFLPR